MAKKLNKEEKEFVKKVAKDSFDMIIDVDNIRKAFKLIMDDDQVPMQKMRQELFKVHSNPDSIEVDESTAEGLPVPDRFKKKIEEAKVTPIEFEAIGLGNLEDKEEKKIDKRSKEYRDSLKNKE